jgi:hypothetical protein
MPESERIEILEALECVDFITLFSEERVDRLLLMLKPHIHAKGTDYTEETVPERETVLSYGGRIAIVGDAKTHSTTDLIRAIARLEKENRPDPFAAQIASHYLHVVSHAPTPGGSALTFPSQGRAAKAAKDTSTVAGIYSRK